MSMINFEIDGKQVSVPKNSTVMDGANQVGDIYPPFLLSQEIIHCRQLPHVSRPGREGTEAATRLRHSGHGGHEGVHPLRAGSNGAERSDGIPAHQSSSWTARFAIRAANASCRTWLWAMGRAHHVIPRRSGWWPTRPRSPDFHRHDAVHPLHTLRTFRPGNRRSHGTGHDWPGRACRDPVICWQYGRFRAVRQYDRSLSRSARWSASHSGTGPGPGNLSRRKSISPHCGLGSNLIVQVQAEPCNAGFAAENEEINECWLSDKDRFSYEGLNSEERLRRPMLRHDGQWYECDWQTALEFVTNRIKSSKGKVWRATDRRAGFPSQHPGGTLFTAKTCTPAKAAITWITELRQSDFRERRPSAGYSVAGYK